MTAHFHDASPAAMPDPLRVGLRVARRFMSIDPPPNTYMYHLGISALLDLYEAGGDERLLDFALAFYTRQDDGKPAFNWRLYQATGDERWLAGARDAGEAWLANPRRDREGALLDPRGRYTVDIVSGLATVPVVFGHVLGDHRYFDEAFLQLDIARSYLEDPVTGLWYSRWGHGLHPHRPNPGLWGRGNGWLVNAWGRVMHLWDPSHARYAEVSELWQHYCAAQLAFQTPSGLFRQLMNRPWSFEEATGSGLIGSGIGYGVLHGTLPPEMGAGAFRAAMGLARLVDDEGNIHNVSTTAGGYNFEQQYESCGCFNDAHGDGSVMGACAAVHRLLQTEVTFDRTMPVLDPVIITCCEPGCISFWTTDMADMADATEPVVERLQGLERLPEIDRQGATVLGLLLWHDLHPQPALFDHACRLFATDEAVLTDVARLRLTAEIARRAPGGADELTVPAVDAWLAAAARDREGLLLDAEGGYTIDLLHHLLPLLGRAGAITGDMRYFDEACTQLLGYREWLEEPVTGLWHSAYGHGSHIRRVTPGFWGLGHGYVLSGTVDLLDDLPCTHPNYVDVVCLLRDLTGPMHEWLPVRNGWGQLLNDRLSFSCVATTGLLTYALGKAVWRELVKSGYYAAPIGGLYYLGKLVHADGSCDAATLPTGGLDTIDAYAAHRVDNAPYALGYALAGYTAMQRCRATDIVYDAKDRRLGAR